MSKREDRRLRLRLRRLSICPEGWLRLLGWGLQLGHRRPTIGPRQRRRSWPEARSPGGLTHCTVALLVLLVLLVLLLMWGRTRAATDTTAGPPEAAAAKSGG